jgi:hypothetical protein
MVVFMGEEAASGLILNYVLTLLLVDHRYKE